MLTKARVLFWCGLLSFLPVIFPAFERHPLPGGSENKLTLGLPFSPWLVGAWSQSTIEKHDESSHSFSSQSSRSFNLVLITWSGLFLLVGIGLMIASRRCR